MFVCLFPFSVEKEKYRMRIKKEIRRFCVFVYEWCVLLKPFYGIGKTKTMGLNQKKKKK